MYKMKSPNHISLVREKVNLMSGFKTITVFILKVFQQRFYEFLTKVKSYNNSEYNLPVAITNTGVVCKLLGIVKYTKTYFTKKDIFCFTCGIMKLQVDILFCFEASLTLEEKQKLAKEQEQAQKLKSQQPLKPQVHTPVAPVKQVRIHFVCIISNILTFRLYFCIISSILY